MPSSAHDLNSAARQAAKGALRGYGELTSGLRASPDFIVIGAKRGGTTSLYNYLLEHPSIAPLFPGRERIKGVHYFDSGFARGPRWYHSHFPLAAGGRHLARPWVTPALTGEASPYYLFHPLAAQRLADQLPEVRLVVMLRDPVERAYSHYKERTRHSAEPLSFEEALDAEPGRLSGEAERIIREPGYHSTEHEDHSYVAQSRYLDMLPRWFGLFPRDRFYIAPSEEFYADPERIVSEVWAFLGLRPAGLRSRKRYNYHPAVDLLPDTRRRLERAFAGHNRELAQLIGRPLPWPGSGPPPAPASQAGRAPGSQEAGRAPGRPAG